MWHNMGEDEFWATPLQEPQILHWCIFLWTTAEIVQVNLLTINWLFCSIINRGKLLHSAMNSLHNFDRSLDKFLAWLSEAESSMECVEAETDRLGGRRDPGLLRQPLHQLKVRNSQLYVSKKLCVHCHFEHSHWYVYMFEVRNLCFEYF